MGTEIPTRQRIDWLSVGFAGIWLVFLVFPLSQVLLSDQLDSAPKVLSLCALALFAVVYLASYGAPWLLRGRETWHTTFYWCLLLLIPTVALTYIGGPWWFYLSTYFVAMWAFQTPPRIELPVGGCCHGPLFCRYGYLLPRCLPAGRVRFYDRCLLHPGHGGFISLR